ncbi:hypothetical protein DFJ43DRAFT_991428, partial [Lentinula guzmanii]
DNAEAGETVEDEDEAMMAMMGVAGFGSTKACYNGKHVEGNQEGSVNVKKSRTWRQYMNRSAYSYFTICTTNISIYKTRGIQQVSVV